MTANFDILCIGSVLWDVIGRCEQPMRQGSDMPGRITRLPGGVMLNIAMALARFGLRPALLSAVGNDPEGDELIAACAARGLVTEHIYRSDDLPTDQYMAVEGSNGLIAAVADAHSLETAGDEILLPLTGGTLPDPFTGAIVLDGNLTADLLATIAQDPIFAQADLRVAPASPGKASRLRSFLRHRRGTLYVNLEEANVLCQQDLSDTKTAAQAMLAQGAQRAVVTNGGDVACVADAGGIWTQTPPPVSVTRITGAGDTFMAAHIAAELAGADPVDALDRALQAAALYVAGETAI